MVTPSRSVRRASASSNVVGVAAAPWTNTRMPLRMPATASSGDTARADQSEVMAAFWISAPSQSVNGESKASPKSRFRCSSPFLLFAYDRRHATSLPFSSPCSVPRSRGRRRQDISLPPAIRQRVASQATAMSARLVETRRDIHRHPELGFRETRTAKLIADRLRALGFDEVREQVGVTGVVGVLKGGRPGKVVAVRSDMDALPIPELIDVPYKSTVPDVKHACGHDGHIAIALAVAEIFSGMRADIPGTVVFLFQPAEEGDPDGGTTGAQRMLEGGALRGSFASGDLRPARDADAAGRHARRQRRAGDGQQQPLHADHHRQEDARRLPAHRHRPDSGRRAGDQRAPDDPEPHEQRRRAHRRCRSAPSTAATASTSSRTP